MEPDDHPILDTLRPVLEQARWVSLNEGQIPEVAGWMAYENLPWPDFRAPFIPEGDPREVMDFIFLTSTLNFAFTDFVTHRTFKVDFIGQELSDSDAMMACLKRALDAGFPILEGEYLTSLSVSDMEEIFRGNILIPLLDRRLEILREIGHHLQEKYRGRFHHFVESCPPRLYDNGRGLLERLVDGLASFRDESQYLGHSVRFQKRAQLLFWILHARFRRSSFFTLQDADQLTAFADYILPAALRILGILDFHPQLEATIEKRELIAAHSPQEVEIRASTLWAVHLLTREINRRRPAHSQVIEPVIDARLWSHYHTTHWPHHLTITSAY